MIATTDPAKGRLHAYVAPFALEWLATAPERRHRSVDATVVFIDVSGFTALTERLAARGKAGAEEVSEVIGGAFAELLGVADAYGGELLKWGGDAALLLFRDADAAARGCSAAWRMSKLMARIGKVRTSAGKVKLGVSAGVNSGRFDLYLLGDEYRELVVTGPAATMTAELEHDASAGEVLVGASTAALIDAAALGEHRGRGILLRAAPSAAVVGDAGAPTPTPAPAPAPTDVRGVDPGMLLCPTVRDHLLGGGEPAEHRYASIAFIEFSGVDDAWTEGGPALVARELDIVVRRAQHAAQDHGVTFFYTDIGPDGGKILLTGGVPVVSGNDEERLLRVALRVVSDHAGPLRLRAGLNAGRFFVHDAGRPERRVYSFSGDAVNLAARVMAHAQPGEVLATNSLLDRVRSNVRVEPLMPFLVKGKIEPVVASRVLGFDRDSETARDDDPFIGREQELATLVDAASQSSNGRGQVVDVVAEPGMGKSRLIAEAASRWDIATRRVVCESYGHAAPYVPFNHLLRALLEIPADAGSAAVAEALRGFVTARAPALIPWLPLLAAVFDVSVPATPEVDRLEPRFRRDRLEEATVSLLDALVTSPMAIIFEDAHAADDPSRSLVARIAAVVATRQWLLVVTRRPDVDLDLPRTAPWFSEVRLDSLSAEESASLLATATNAPALLPHERKLLMERAGGSPLFLRELLEGYRATGSVEDLPDTLEPLLALQVDRLAPADRSLLRAAAVLGVWFDLQTLTDLLGSSVALDSTVWDRLAPFVVDETAGQKRFRHSLVRDAAYEGLSFKRRRVLHGSAAESIAGRSVTPEEHASLLSLHSLHAELFADAWRYARVAGDKASELYANVEAATYYRRALTAARRLPSVPETEVGHVWESLGDTSERAGEYAEAAHAYATSRKVSRTRTDRARLLRKSGIVHERNARYRAALSCYTRGRTLTREPVEKSQAVELCELTIAYSGVRFRQGRHLECLEWAEAAVEQAAEIEYQPGMAHALYLQDIALSSLGRSSNGTAERALAIYEEMRDLIGQGNVLNNMGVEAYFRGRWTDALQLYERSGAAREQAGDIAGAATEQNNIAEILSDQGHAVRARELFLVAREAWLAAGYNVGVALATSNLGRLAARCGTYEEAGLLLRDARERFRSIGAAVHALEAEARLVELLVLEQRTDQAKSDAELLASKVETLGVADALETMTRRLLGIAKAHGGDREGGLAELDRSVARAADQGEEFELALGLAARVSLQHDSAASRSSRLWRADAARAVDMLESLGVVDVPVTSSDDRWPQHGVAILGT